MGWDYVSELRPRPGLLFIVSMESHGDDDDDDAG
jgi:hypothetical protein